MRKIMLGLFAAVLALSFLTVEPVQAKVYKMKPEERAAAMREKKARRAKGKKSKAAKSEGDAQGGWVEVKPGKSAASREVGTDKSDKAEKRKSHKKKAEADENLLDKQPEKKGKHKSKKAAAEETQADQKAEKKGKRKGKKAAAEEAQADQKAEKKAERKGHKSRRTSDFADRPARDRFSRSSGAEPKAGGDTMGSYSVTRPGYEKGSPFVPEVRQSVQPGPLDTSKPVDSPRPVDIPRPVAPDAAPGEPAKGAEGRF